MSALAILQEMIRDAAARRQPLRIRGEGSKDFYGEAPRGEVLDTRALSGIVDYEPSELVLTARAGTPLSEIEAALAQRGQMLAFEPPRYGGGTLGGTVASGLSGPRRAYAGAVRDFVLGVRLAGADGVERRFGGQVIKNVAGFDVARLVAGSLGTLGLISEVSLKTLPRPPAEATLRFAMDEARALRCLNEWAGQPLPLSGSCWLDGILHVRLSGAEAAVRAACERLGGERVEGAALWDEVRDQRHAFFRTPTLWRLSLPQTAPPLATKSPQLIEWNGGLRWLVGAQDAAALRTQAQQLGGHATLFRGEDKSAGVFQPLAPPLLALQRRVKAALDPAGLFNPGRMYREI